MPIIRKSQGEGPRRGSDHDHWAPQGQTKNEPTTGNINWNIMFQLIFRAAVGLANDMEGIISSVKDPWRKGNDHGHGDTAGVRGESMAWLVTSTDNAPEVWTLNKVALIRSVRPVPCWKCGYKTIQTGLFLELAGRDGYRCRIVSWSGVDKAGLLSQAFRRLLDVNWGVRPKYSKSMGCEYLAGVCPHCGAIQG